RVELPADSSHAGPSAHPAHHDRSRVRRRQLPRGRRLLGAPFTSPEDASMIPPAPRSKLNVVLFSGGSGTQSITEAFLKHPQIALTILINAYDDGHSTGRLRRFIPGMLGPSDVRKNINRLMPQP